MEERDIVIIGGGPAGYSAAIRASQLGGKVTLVEQDTLGGTCINRGCIPTRTLVRAVELLDMGSKAKDYGITYTDMGIDFTKMNARKDTIVKILVTSVKQVLNGKGVEIIEGKAKLISPSQIELQLKDGMKKELTARRIILATGSRCKKLSFPWRRNKYSQHNASTGTHRNTPVYIDCRRWVHWCSIRHNLFKVRCDGEHY